jgi:hypothetical protein
MDISKYLQQTAVYWGSPTPDGEGGFIWSAPVEVPCRWTDVTQMISLSNGQQVVSRSSVLVDQDVDEGGMFFLGTLNDFDSDEGENPIVISGAYKIGRFEKIPDRTATTFLRKAYLWEGARV